MNMITGYLGATSGEIKINGHDILKEPEKAKKCIGYLPELPPLYMDMTVKEYLCFVADLKQLEKKSAQTVCGRGNGNDRYDRSGRAHDPQSVQRIPAACRVCTGDPGVSGDYHTR